MRSSTELSRRSGIALPTSSANPLAMWGALSVVYVVWGSTYLAIRVAIRTLPPLMMSGVRFLIAGSLLYAFSITRGDRTGDKPTLEQWKAAAIIGGCLLLGGNGLVAIAEQHITSSIAALLVAMVPLWMAIYGFMFYKERLTPAAVAGLVIGFAGVGVLVDPTGAGRVSPLGVGLLVGATTSWSLGSLYARKAPMPKRPLVAVGMQMLAGGALLTVGGIARGELAEVDLAGVSGESAFAWAYLVVFGSLAAFTAYSWVLRVARTSIVATYAYVNPVVAVFLGWLLLSEPITARTLVAGAIIVVGVALIVTARATDPRAAAPPETPAEPG